ncbi:Uncharacterised protein [Bordetella pertussis]|nr:Uncharacterised protein [Bordetella pertussis]
MPAPRWAPASRPAQAGAISNQPYVPVHACRAMS